MHEQQVRSEPAHSHLARAYEMHIFLLILRVPATQLEVIGKQMVSHRHHAEQKHAVAAELGQLSERLLAELAAGPAPLTSSAALAC